MFGNTIKLKMTHDEIRVLVFALNELRKRTENYDIIYESNVFNHNEHIQKADLRLFRFHLLSQPISQL